MIWTVESPEGALELEFEVQGDSLLWIIWHDWRKQCTSQPYKE